MGSSALNVPLADCADCITSEGVIALIGLALAGGFLLGLVIRG